MKTNIIRTPARINLAFLALLILPLIFAFGIYKASASTDCRTEFYNGFFQEIDSSIQKQCGKKFEYFTRIEIKRMNNYATFTSLKK